jgi:hypothetical protein
MLILFLLLADGQPNTRSIAPGTMFVPTVALQQIPPLSFHGLEGGDNRRGHWNR